MKAGDKNKLKLKHYRDLLRVIETALTLTFENARFLSGRQYCALIEMVKITLKSTCFFVCLSKIVLIIYIFTENVRS